MKMWSGRFRQPLDPGFERWQRSFAFDRDLLHYELAASGAHARALKNAGVLSSDELIGILQGLEQIGEKAAASRVPRRCRSGRRASLCGEATGRADRRNWIQAAQRAQPQRADRHRSAAVRPGGNRSIARRTGGVVRRVRRSRRAGGDAAMPAYTHLQRAEPVLVAHWLLAYVEMFLRDAERLADCRKRVNVCPLGSGAVAGATLALWIAALWQTSRFRRSHREQHRRHQRSRFRARIRAGACRCLACI